MGITGLIPFLEKASKKCNVSDFKGYSVAIDAYCWLHKGSFSCADKIARGEFTDAHIKYCMKYVNMLLSHSIKPILVFDGRHLPAKALTETKRRESRNVAKKRAAELLRLGKVEEARSYMRRCVDITHEMALLLIKECRQKNVDCIVAPYEADAQMAYLNRIGVADIVITEDSDLVLFGCSKILFKMDLNGDGVLVESSKLPLVMKCPLEHYDFNKFRQMCIMSGCDYLPSLPGIGLAKARQFINATRDPDIRNALRKVPTYFNKSQLVVSEEYRDSFMRAEATFKHQLVYDPMQRKLLPLNTLEAEGTDEVWCSNAGEYLDPSVAFQLALGNIDPFTLKKMDDWNPDDIHNHVSSSKTNSWQQLSKAPHRSMWSRDYLEYLKRQRTSRNLRSNTDTAITFPSTRTLTTKVFVANEERVKDNGLTMEDLTSMYCIKQSAVVKKNVIVPETQDFEDYESLNPFSKCPSSPSKTVLTNINNCSSSAKKRRRPSIDRENSLSPEKDKSPILQSRNSRFRNYLNKMSKFQRTVVDENICVESKFFNSSKVDEEISMSEETGLNVSGIAKLNVEENNEDKYRNLSNILDPITDSVHNKRLTNDDQSWCDTTPSVTLSAFEVKKSVNPFRKCSPKKETIDSQASYNENTYPLEDLVTPVASQTSIDLSQNCDITIKENSPRKLVSSLSQSSLPSKAANKNVFKSNGCRRPGLQRKNSAPILSAGQKTLANFGFFQKSQLKH